LPTRLSALTLGVLCAYEIELTTARPQQINRNHLMYGWMPDHPRMVVTNFASRLVALYFVLFELFPFTAFSTTFFTAVFTASSTTSSTVSWTFL